MKIRRAAANDINAIINLSDKYIGEGFYTFEYLSGIIDNPNEFLFVYDYEDAGVIAFLYFFTDTLANACKRIHIPESADILKNNDNNMKVCVFKTTCIDKDYRNKYIMTDFLDAALNDISKLNIELYMALAMRINTDNAMDGLFNKGDEPGARLLINIGFEREEIIDKPWNDQSFYCPYCGRNNCICDGSVYIKRNTTIRERQL